jgi:hypothetical protein
MASGRGAGLAGAAGWMTVGAVVLAASWRMDRLESLSINPWSAPGLVPGLLGALMMLFGAVLAARGPGPGLPAPPPGSAMRISIALCLCFGFAAGLLGRGWPFWLTSALFLFAGILAFRWLDRDGSVSAGRLAASSAGIAGAASTLITFLFQEVFLVRLP